MIPVAILETHRLTPTGEWATEFTLVENPLTGEQRTITAAEAQEIIESRRLQRFPVATGRGAIRRELGAVWDTWNQSYKEMFSVDSYHRAQQKHLTRGVKKYTKRRKITVRWSKALDLARRDKHDYKKRLFNKIDNLFKIKAQ